MSTKRKTYSADFKAKLVLQVLEGEKTLNEIASQYEILPKNLQNWKKQFLEKLRLNYKMNHFAIKEKIYIEALKIAYEKVGKLMVA